MTAYDNVLTVRTIIELPAADVAILDRLSKGRQRSRAALIRDAVVDYLAAHRSEAAEAFGLWADRAEDGLAYQDRVRSEW